MNDIRMVDLTSQYLRFKSQMDEAMQLVASNADFIQGKAVKAFETNLASAMNVPFCISCGNGTDALQLAFMALDLSPGSEVITPSFSYAAVVEVLHLLNLVPVFVDVDPQTFLMDVDALEAAITPKTKAIAPVHLFGQMVNMDRVTQIAVNYQLFVVEDAAQSIGAYWHGEYCNGFAGTIGTIGTTSFFPSKNLGCFGDGGAVFTKDEQFANLLRMIANHGQKVKYEHEMIGVNSRLDTLQAAVLQVKLPYLTDFNARRNEIAQRYTEHLEALGGLNIPRNQNHSTHVFNQYTLVLESPEIRHSLKEFLHSQKIPTMVYYPIPLHKQKAYACEVNLPQTEYLCGRVLSLPICPELTLEKQTYIIQNIQKFIQNNKSLQ